jgi:PIN domain nuclease of toxin-antitoxin system
MTFVLDACAIIAYLRDEIGAEHVENLLLNEKCMVHAVNLCEVYYDCLLRGEDSDIADEFIERLEIMGIESRDDMDRYFWKMIASYKARTKQASLSVSLADCFVLALAERMEATIVTADGREFKPIRENGLFPYEIDIFR